MKVGILSLNLYTTDLNYACRIHSYAFQQFLDEHDIDNVIIDYVPAHCNPNFDMRHPLNQYLKHPTSDTEKQEAAVRKWTELYDERERRYDKTKAFTDSHMRMTDKQYTVKMLDKEDPGCDIYVACTDVLWKFRDRTGFDKAFFLQSECMRGKGKIDYAVSYGGNKYSPELLRQVISLSKDHDYISTREKYLYNVVRKDLKKPAHAVLDPVFLHEASFYDRIAQKPQETGYVLVYNVIRNSRVIVKHAVEYAAARGLKVIELSDFRENAHYPEGTEHTVLYEPGIEEWLGYIKYADCVFTNSFHCCCFSLIFHKEFYAGDRKGEKVQWLLELFNIGHRWLEPDQKIPEEKLDYERIDQLRKMYKQESADFILNAIQNLEFRQMHPEMAGALPGRRVMGIEKSILEKLNNNKTFYGQQY